MDSIIAALLADPSLQAARARLEAEDEQTLAWQAELSAIPAPTGQEEHRAARVADQFRALGLEVRVDDAGNVQAWHGAPGPGAIMLAAHLDTVFGPEVDVRVNHRGRRLEGPGISDNARGLAALLAVADALRDARVALERPVAFVATVGEEGAGDLRGVKHLFHVQRASPAAFIAVDGAGMDRVAHRALASKRVRATYRGPGGHSWAAFGVANPAHAAGAAAGSVGAFDLPSRPQTTCAVVRLGGGTALNSIPQEVWLDFDVRSEHPRTLRDTDARLREALTHALDAENRRRVPGSMPLRLELATLGDRPGGTTPEESPLVRAAVAATRALGREPELAAASTDANVPIALGIPSVALGAGGRAGEAHLPTEWFENVDGPAGLFRALLVTTAAARSD